jgi:transcriptional regulator with XRE-family HTH domain
VKELHLTQAEVADKCGVSRSYFTNVVNGKATPNVAIICGIVRCYRIINERWLLTGEGVMLKSQEKLPAYDKLLNEIEIIKQRLDKLEEI